MRSMNLCHEIKIDQICAIKLKTLINCEKGRYNLIRDRYSYLEIGKNNNTYRILNSFVPIFHSFLRTFNSFRDRFNYVYIGSNVQYVLIWCVIHEYKSNVKSFLLF